MYYLYGIIIGLVVVACLGLVRHRSSGTKKKSFSASQTGYYDIHTHILYGADHGAADINMSMDMLKKEVEEGISTVILTPHYFPGKTKKELLVQFYNELKQEVEKAKLPVKIYLGNEFLYNTQAMEDLIEGKVCTLCETSYVLTEFHSGDSYEYIRNGLSEMLAVGYRPVLAHVERYAALRKKEKVRELIQMGVFIQVNSNSYFKKDTRNYVLNLTRNDMVHFLASDCHNMTDRPPGTEKARCLLQSELTQEQYETLCKKNPDRLLLNQYI